MAVGLLLLHACMPVCLPQPLLSSALHRHVVSLKAVQMMLSLAPPAAHLWGASAAASGSVQVPACCPCAETRDDPGEAGTSLFVEPLQWMQAELDHGEVQGKLYCPG